ncbi:MAG: hypothetical protein HKN68_00545 [Saprospiraceae bacterium]|nr:hypothetical protein [Saprospiraceae bacterium]
MQAERIKKDEIFAALPKLSESHFLSSIQEVGKEKVDAIIVLDDDPTGTQTVSDVPVLTQWDTDTIISEFQNESPLFFILTNSRSLTEKEAKEQASTIGKNIQRAAKKTGTRYWVISRSDSTLRGHYPAEFIALEEGLEWKNGVHFIIPAFFEGGRYTIDNIHYVLNDDELIPAAQTPFAEDKVFGFKNSELRHWVVEKNDGKIAIENVATISIEELRTASEDALIEKLNHFKDGTLCVVNAADYQDLHFFSLALMKTEIQPLFRTAASFVSAIAGLEKKPLLSGKTIRDNSENGGLIIVGSYVPTSSSQLYHLLSHREDIQNIEIQVDQILGVQNQESLYQEYVNQINGFIRSGQTVVVYTSRKLVSAESDDKNQEIGKTVSNFITQIISHLDVCPAYLLTKGGITSSDIATKGLGIKRAIVRGQIIKGVPVWELGGETRFPKSHQIIFPGNVGTNESLTEVVEKLMK